MIDIKLDYKALHDKIMFHGLYSVASAVRDLRKEVSDEKMMACFEQAVIHAAIARAILEVIDMQMSDETELRFDGLIEETATKMASCFCDVHDKVVAASEVPKVQA